MNAGIAFLCPGQTLPTTNRSSTATAGAIEPWQQIRSQEAETQLSKEKLDLSARKQYPPHGRLACRTGWC